MSRLYLITLICCFSVIVFGQSPYKKYVLFAEEKRAAGDYIHALDYYDKAMELDSSSLDVLWAYAETLRAYKDYNKAAYYYGKVYDGDSRKIYPSSLMYYGLMQKQSGNYEKAIDIFKESRKVYRDRRSYHYLKCRREKTSCEWAISVLNDSADVIFEHLPPQINTKDAEFAHNIYDNKLLYSSLRADSVGENEEIYSTVYRTHLYKSKIVDEDYEEPEKIEDLFWADYSSGNGSFSPDSSRFYFSLCENDAHNYSCKIMVAKFKNGRFKNIDSLGTIINSQGSNTTMPFSTKWDNDEVLFFASDREGGQGGMDIWYSKVTNGNRYSTPVNIKAINSLDNELSPFWDDKENKLYFSSSWYDGFGGYDIFESTFDGSKFSEPNNLGVPFNSPANDLYFFKTSGDSSYLSSNRLGSYYSKNPTCCSDIYMTRIPYTEEPITIIEEEDDPLSILIELNKKLPVTLYFHNDIPDPRSWDTVSEVNYLDSYKNYTAMLQEYKTEYSKGLSKDESKEAKENMKNFFEDYVDKGVKDLFEFRDALLGVLDNGYFVELTIKGFASPLAKTDYNVNLTKRRIASLLNYLAEYDDGSFKKYINNTAENGGGIRIVQISYGEYDADQLISDNPNDMQNSVYSIAAALERKIEIQSVEFVLDNEELNILTAKSQIIDAGEVTSRQIIEKTFTITNEGKKAIEIDEIQIPCDCNTVKLNKSTLEPGESTTLVMTFDTSMYKGHQVKSIYLNYSGGKEKLRLVLTAEVR